MALIQASGAVVSKNELVRRVWQLRIVDENRQSDTRLLRCARLLRRLRHSDRNDRRPAPHRKPG
jgi:DNA-binding winged helix-turn-helix (wHTH) protein